MIVDVNYELARGELSDVLPSMAAMPDRIESEEAFWAWNDAHAIGFKRLTEVKNSRIFGACRYRPFARRRGGVCEIFPSHDTKTGNVVVVKKLCTELEQDSTFRRLFHNEVVALKKLRGHPRWVQILDVISETEMILELVIGIPLDAWLIAYKLFSLQQRIYLAALIGRDSAEALAPLHSLEKISCDVSPPNIILCKQGVKMIDLNIVKPSESKLSHVSGVVLGRFQYLSPETARSNVQGAASDYYSIGAVLYAVIIGHSPLVSSNDEVDGKGIELLRRAQDSTHHTELLPSNTPVSGIIKALLAANPSERPSTSAVLTELLLPFAGAPRTHIWTPDESPLPGETKKVGAVLEDARSMLRRLLSKLGS